MGLIDAVVDHGKLAGVNPKDLIGSKKVAMVRMPPIAVLHGNHALMDGAAKYGPYNWREEGKAVQASIYIDACQRHVMAWFDREETADDSGVHHLGHAIGCLAILLDAQACGQLIDDRPEKSGAFVETLKRLNAQIKEKHEQHG